MFLSYWKLLRQNSKVRVLWLAQSISLFGDWFTAIALLDYVSTPSHVGEASTGLYISLVFICGFGAQFLMGPVAGVVADRMSRKKIMIYADLIRGTLVLGFLWVLFRTESLWGLYVTEILIFSSSSFFLAARGAVLPNLVRDSTELLYANSLGQITWGMMLSLGAISASLSIQYFGLQWTILVDAITYFFSALILYFLPDFFPKFSVSTHVYQQKQEKIRVRHAIVSVLSSNVQMFQKGIQYIRDNRFILGILMMKAGWAIGGGAILTLHTVFGKDVFQAGEKGIGLLYSSRGMGVILGSFLSPIFFYWAKRFGVLWVTVGIILVYASLYAWFSQMTNIFWATFILILGTSLTANLWILSRISIQKVVPDGFRGRVIAHDESLTTLFTLLSALMGGFALQNSVPPRLVALSSALLIFVWGLVFFLGLWFGFFPKDSRIYPKGS